MKKIFFLIILIFLIGIILFVFFKYSEPIEPVKRPANVPSDAVWHGGADGGNWIQCLQIKDSTNIFFCNVYSDFTGDIIYKGLFKLEGKETSIDELKELLGFYSGDYINLKDNRVMKTVVPIDSSSYEEMMSRDINDYQK